MDPMIGAKVTENGQDVEEEKKIDDNSEEPQDQNSANEFNQK